MAAESPLTPYTTRTLIRKGTEMSWCITTLSFIWTWEYFCHRRKKFREKKALRTLTKNFAQFCFWYFKYTYTRFLIFIYLFFFIYTKLPKNDFVNFHFFFFTWRRSQLLGKHKYYFLLGIMLTHFVWGIYQLCSMTTNNQVQICLNLA